VTSPIQKKPMERNRLKEPKFQNKKRKAAYMRVTTRLAQESEHYFGEQNPPIFSIVRIFSRPFSDIVQCRVQWPQRNFGIYIKFSLVQKKKEGEHERILRNTTREIDVMQKFSDFFSQENAVSVPDVVAFFPDELAVVTKEKEGLPLMKLIVGSAKGKPCSKDLNLLKQACYSIGHALRVFQKMPLIDTGRDELPSNLIAYIDLRLKLLSDSGFIKTSESLHVLHYIEKQLSKIDKTTLTLCGVHGDLSLGNVLISPEYVVFLDLGMYRKGTSYFDLAFFYQHLDDFRTNPFFLKSTIIQLQDAFLEGYQEDSIREKPLFLAYYVRNSVNQLLDLSRTNHLSLIKKIYQKWQYRSSLCNLKIIVEKN